MNFDALETWQREGFEQLTAFRDPRSGARGVLALHSTQLGPAFGGIRRWSYSDLSAAARDALRLARAMTHKCALADLPAGGGKIVLLDTPGVPLEAQYEHVGDLVQGLNGRYFAGPDVGAGEAELAAVRRRTSWVTDPGPDGPGELAAATATGVVHGIAAALEFLDGAADWPRRTIVVQGLGEVGARVAAQLRERGVRVLAADVDAVRAARVAAEVGLELIDSTAQLDTPCDVFAPCALGGILHDVTLVRARCRVLAGSANNVLAAPEHGDRLHARGVLFVPDIAISSGALIRGATFALSGARTPLEEIGARVAAVVRSVLASAAARGEPPARFAEREAERRVELAGAVR